MRILVVTQYFWPENFRINDLCIELKKRGHDLTVLTGSPNYPEGKVFPEYLKSPGEFGDLQGMQVIRVPIFPRGKGSVRLLMNYLSYPVSSCIAVLFKFRKKNFDVVFVCQLSPIFIAFPAILYRFFSKTPVVMWVLDLWPESLKSVSIIKSQVFLKFIGSIVTFIYNRCDLILGQSPSFRKDISNYTDLEGKFGVLYNWAEDIFSLPVITNTEEMLKTRDNAFNIIFAGNVGDAQSLDTAVRAFKLVIDKGTKVKFHIIGDGRALVSLKQMTTDLSLGSSVFFYGRLPLESMPQLFNEADALFLSLKSSPVFDLTIPGKLQSYLASGKPIIAALSGEAKNIIEYAKCGLCSEAENIEGLAKNIEKICTLKESDLLKMAANARAYFEECFSKNTIVDKLENDLVALINKS